MLIGIKLARIDGLVRMIWPNSSRDQTLFSRIVKLFPYVGNEQRLCHSLSELDGCAPRYRVGADQQRG